MGDTHMIEYQTFAEQMGRIWLPSRFYARKVHKRCHENPSSLFPTPYSLLPTPYFQIRNTTIRLQSFEYRNKRLAFFHENRISFDLGYVSRQRFRSWPFNNFAIRTKGGIVTGANKGFLVCLPFHRTSSVCASRINSRYSLWIGWVAHDKQGTHRRLLVKNLTLLLDLRYCTNRLKSIGTRRW